MDDETPPHEVPRKRRRRRRLSDEIKLRHARSRVRDTLALVLVSLAVIAVSTFIAQKGADPDLKILTPPGR